MISDPRIAAETSLVSRHVVREMGKRLRIILAGSPP